MDWVVGPRPGAGPLALQVVEVDPSPCVRVGRHGDHPGRAGLLHAVQEQVGEQERREMVDRKGASQPVGGDVPSVPVPADIVDQHIDPSKALNHLAGKSAHLGLRGQVSNEHLHLPAAGGTDLGRRDSVGPRSRPVIARSAPIAAKPRAVARPIPLPAPVTSTVLPAMCPGRSARSHPGSLARSQAARDTAG